jgi:DNA-directed RNA polymerase subunit RPC12/RpoP
MTTDWYCFKCKEKMIEGEIKLIYLEIEAPAGGIVCPKCGAKYIPEELAIDKVAKGEKMIENK